MGDVPEWFERLKAEWPAAWEYESESGEAVLALGCLSLSVWLLKGKFAGSAYSTSFDEDIGLVETVAELRSLTGALAEFYAHAFAQVAAAAGLGKVQES